MAMNLEAILRIAAQVVGEENVKALGTALKGVETAAGDAKNAFKNVVDSSAFQAAAVAAAAVGTAIALSTREAIAFESSMAEVRKVVNGLDTPEGMRAIRQEIFELSREIPITAQGFADMYAAAGQAGIPREELRAFAQDVSMVAVAFDMTAGEAGTAMAKLRTNLGLTQEELMSLADAANFLSNNMASTAREIVEFMLRSGSAGQAAGLTAEQTAAFGSAMIASGAAAEVASTSFNNMIKALSRGGSMTERQVGALVRLGYAGQGVEDMERRMTAAVEQESAERLRAIETESRQMVSEINRRYRDIAQIQQDNWDDEEREWSRNQDDRMDAILKRIQRERQAEIDASNERAKASGADNRSEIQAIEDKYDERMKAVRRGFEDERVEYQRAQRDFQQDVKDQLDDQRQMEVEAVQAKYEELKKIEEARKKLAIEDAKATAKAMVGELGPKMAKMLQQDAVGTIRDVFARIKALPAEMQMSVISDLFGDEARALLPLINNSQLLDTALGLVGDKSKYAGSTAKEFAARIQTTEAKLQLLKNRVTELAIVFGESFLPAIQALINVFAPLFEGFSWLIQNVPFLGPVLAAVTAAFVALVALAPFIASFLTIAQGIAGLGLGATVAGWAGAIGPTIAAIGAWFVGLPATIAGALGAVVPVLSGAAATIAGWAGAIGPILAGVGGFFKAMLAVVAGVFTGPVGWIALIAGAVVALIAFREPIGQFVAWVGQTLWGWIQSLWELGEPIRQFWINLWAGIVELSGAFFGWLGQVWNTYLAQPLSVAVQAVAGFFAGLWEGLKAAASAWFEWWSAAVRALVVEPWLAVTGALLSAANQVWTAIQGVVSGFFEWFGGFVRTYYVEPWLQVGGLLVDAAVATWSGVTTAVSTFFSWIGGALATYLVEPIGAALRAVGEFFSSMFEGVREFVVAWFAWWGEFLYKAFVEPWIVAGRALVDAAVEIWTSITNDVSAFFSAWVNFVKTYALPPFVAALEGIVQRFSSTFEAVGHAVSGFFSFWVEAVSTYLVEPIAAGLRGFAKFFADAFAGVADFLRGWFGWWAEFFYKAFIEPIQLALSKLGELFSVVWSAVADLLIATFEAIREAWSAVTTALASLWQSFVDAVQRAWSGVANAFVQNVVNPISSAWQTFTSNLAQWFSAGVAAVSSAMSAIATAFNNVVVQPIVAAWGGMVRTLGEVMASVTSTLTGVWDTISSTLRSAFEAIGTAFSTYVSGPISAAWEAVVGVIGGALDRAVKSVQSAYQAIAGAITGAFRGIVGTVGNVINSIIGALNQLIRAVNKVRSAVGLSSFSEIPLVNIPSFAEGGVVRQATLAVVGEGNEDEYIIPASKMAAAAQNYLDGRRGESVLEARPRVEVGGAAPLVASTAPTVNVAAPTFRIGGGDTSVSITTGPVQQVGGERLVTLEDLQKAVVAASRQTRESLLRELSQPGTRQRLGMA
jgi:phage-related protein